MLFRSGAQRVRRRSESNDCLRPPRWPRFPQALLRSRWHGSAESWISLTTARRLDPGLSYPQTYVTVAMNDVMRVTFRRRRCGSVCAAFLDLAQRCAARATRRSLVSTRRSESSVVRAAGKVFLSGADRHLEPVLGRRQRATPVGVVSAVRVVRVVEVDDDLVAVGV